MAKEKDLELAIYYDYYGQLLTEKQARAFELYYNDDYSLSEVGEELGISRQGALDTIKRASAKLKDLEQKLGLVEKGLRED